MRRILVCGIGTDVGKTLVSAILVQALGAHFWKPIQAGNLEASDSHRVKELVEWTVCYPETYRLRHALSPHLGAELEGIEIQKHMFKVPTPPCPLIIEAVGGVMVPLRQDLLFIDLLMEWECEWVIVSRHYVGSINHTLLTLEVLQRRQVNLRGIIFNGPDQPSNEKLILDYAKAPCIGHLYPEPVWKHLQVKQYACLWKSHF
jgi:dethiobiotin synthetase